MRFPQHFRHPSCSVLLRASQVRQFDGSNWENYIEQSGIRALSVPSALTAKGAGAGAASGAAKSSAPAAAAPGVHLEGASESSRAP